MTGPRGAYEVATLAGAGRRIGRRDMVRLMTGLAAASCTGLAAHPAPPVAAGSPGLRLDPLVDLVPAAGLIWLVQARPTDLWSGAATHRVATRLVPPARLDSFAAGHGGVDLRQTREMVVAGFDASTVTLVSTPCVPERVVAAFSARTTPIHGSVTEQEISRVWGSRGDGSVGEELAVFDNRAVGLERGRGHVLRVATLFAEGRLHRALPALRAQPLAAAAAAIGEAPLRAFAPGPFDGEAAQGLGGLLRATTAVAATVRSRSDTELVFHFSLIGAWGKDADRATERLSAVFETLAVDPVGRLIGADRPVAGPYTWHDSGTLRLEVTLDADTVARGLHDATEASVEEMMSY